MFSFFRKASDSQPEATPAPVHNSDRAERSAPEAPIDTVSKSADNVPVISSAPIAPDRLDQVDLGSPEPAVFADTNSYKAESTDISGTKSRPHNSDKKSQRNTPDTKSNRMFEKKSSARCSQRLSTLGYVLPVVPTPVAAYTPARISAASTGRTRLIVTSGQLPFVEGKLVATGKVGAHTGQLATDYAYQLAKVSALNALSAAAQLTESVDDLIGVEKLTVFVASDVDFTDQALVANGASDFFGELFDEPHIRSAVGVAVLPLNSPVEIEATFLARS